MAFPDTIPAIFLPAPGIIPQVSSFVPIIPDLLPWRHSLTLSHQSWGRGKFHKVTAVSNIGDQDLIYYFWFIDGEFVTSTRSPEFSFYTLSNDEVAVFCVDDCSPNLDTDMFKPDEYPRRKVIYFTRSYEAGVKEYRIRQKKSGGSWVVIGWVIHKEDEHEYYIVTDPLDDLSAYEFDITPYDIPGNPGTAKSISSKTHVRMPDSPVFVKTYNTTPDTVTIASS